MIENVFSHVKERDDFILDYIKTASKNQKKELAAQIEDEFFELVAKIDASKMPVASFFDHSKIGLLNIELFSDILFYGYNYTLRYKPFEGYAPIMIEDRINFYDLLFSKYVIAKAISSQVSYRSTSLSPLYTVTADVTFAASHYLPYYEGLCRHLHGHEWKVEVQYATRLLNKMGMVVDFGDIKKKLREKIEKRFDHSFINDTITNPTAEHISTWIYNQLYDMDDENKLISVTVYETPTNKAVVR